ncbi:MAG: glycosyltransferase family 4 protein [Planctomycetes bacterium]|nr:glycosyltransferase family 4 protein [Planctomycetota bacterium]
MKRLLVHALRTLLGGLGLLAGRFAPALQSRLVLVFATPNLGGAERVHAQLAEAVRAARPEIWFTEPGKDEVLLPEYARHGCVRKYGAIARRRAGAYFLAGYLAARVNRQPDTVVVGAFSYLFYDMLPWLRSDVRCVDLLHNFGVRFEHYSLRHVPRLETRVLISESLRADLATLYDAFGLSAALAGRLRVIATGVSVPERQPVKASDGPLRVLYVGRNSPEKRVHLVGRIASRLAAAGTPSQFTLVGDVKAALAPEDLPSCTLAGVVTRPEELAGLYNEADIVLITSEREGFPLAVMEGMARGAVPVCTAVGALTSLPVGEVCVLVEPEDEAAVVARMVDVLTRLARSRLTLNAMGAAAFRYAGEHFSLGRFGEQWRNLLGVGP